MPELGPMMRALELQRLVEDKVSEWRERSARVAAARGSSVTDSYQQPLNFKRHTNKRKNSAEINRIIAKYSQPRKRIDVRVSYATPLPPENTPVRPARHRKGLNFKLSKSEDNLASLSTMDSQPDPVVEIKPPPRFNFTKYINKSTEDVNAFIDTQRVKKSKNFEEKSIMNAKVVQKGGRRKLHSLCEDFTDDFSDSGVDFRDESKFATSTPLSKRMTCPPGENLSVNGFQKCSSYGNGVGRLRKGVSEPDILSVSEGDSADTKNTLNSWKRWKLLKPPFRKGALDCLLLWRGKKSRPQESK